MPLPEYLRGMREQTPLWLNEFQTGGAFPREPFFASRIVYYPSSGTDGHPVKLFGSSHSAHCFVYADYGITQDAVEAELRDPDHGFHGYYSLARLHLAEANLTPNGWVPHVPPGYMAPQGQGHVGADPIRIKLRVYSEIDTVFFRPFQECRSSRESQDAEESHGKSGLNHQC